jgi:hypothetical protein
LYRPADGAEVKGKKITDDNSLWIRIGVCDPRQGNAIIVIVGVVSPKIAPLSLIQDTAVKFPCGRVESINRLCMGGHQTCTEYKEAENYRECFHNHTRARLTSRAQARGTKRHEPRSGTGTAIPRCLQRFVRRIATHIFAANSSRLKAQECTKHTNARQSA